MSSLEITIALIGSGDVASKMSSKLESYFPSGFLHLEILNILPSLVPKNDIKCTAVTEKAYTFTT